MHLPAGMLPLLGSGTSPNEALNHEINSWFRNQPECYQETLRLQLHINCIGKLMSHNSSLYRPTLRQLDARTVLTGVVHMFRIREELWKKYCNILKTEGMRRRKAALPLVSSRAADEPAAREWCRARKKPSSVLKRPGSIKRTPFNLVRSRF
jgi:hypothetical protein